MPQTAAADVTYQSKSDRHLPSTDGPPERRDIDDLDQAILRLSHRMNAENYELLSLIREFDQRSGWLMWGLTSCAHWLHWRCDLSYPAARERVRVAHALKILPEISREFSTGALSYSKVRALTRIATAETETALIEMAKVMTAAHVDQHCRQRRNAHPDSKDDAVSAHARRAMRSWRDERRGMVSIVIELPIADGLLFERAVDKASTDQGGSHLSPDESTSWRAIQADAAMAIARAYLSGLSGDPSSTADQYQVMVHVDHEALTSDPGNQNGKSDMPIDTVKRLCCDGSVVPIIENTDREPLNLGRKQRIVSTAIRRALWARDRGCAFPGCTHTRFVDAHHIKHWANGGETRLDNLVLLCTAHHQMVHEGGYSLERDKQGKRCFKRPDGHAVPECGYHFNSRADSYSENDSAGVVNVHDPAAVD